MIAFALVIFDDHLQNQVAKLAVQCQGRDSDDHESWFMIIPSQVLELVSWTSWLTLIFIKGGNRAEVRRSFITTTVRDEGHTTRAPPVGFELETNGFHCFPVLCHCPLGQDIPNNLNQHFFTIFISIFKMVRKCWLSSSWTCPQAGNVMVAAQVRRPA